ncbi:hypothetical protein D3C86_1524750 [compost metagenome]
MLRGDRHRLRGRPRHRLRLLERLHHDTRRNHQRAALPRRPRAGRQGPQPPGAERPRAARAPLGHRADEHVQALHGSLRARSRHPDTGGGPRLRAARRGPDRERDHPAPLRLQRDPRGHDPRAQARLQGPVRARDLRGGALVGGRRGRRQGLVCRPDGLLPVREGHRGRPQEHQALLGLRLLGAGDRLSSPQGPRPGQGRGRRHRPGDGGRRRVGGHVHGRPAHGRSRHGGHQRHLRPGRGHRVGSPRHRLVQHQQEDKAPHH